MPSTKRSSSKRGGGNGRTNDEEPSTSKSTSKSKSTSSSKALSKKDKQQKAAEERARAKAWSQARKAKKDAKENVKESSTTTMVSSASSRGTKRVTTSRSNARSSTTPLRKSRRMTGKRKANEDSSDEEHDEEKEEEEKEEKEEEDIIVKKPKARPKKRRRMVERDASIEEQPTRKKSHPSTNESDASSRKRNVRKSLSKVKAASTKQVETEVVPISSDAPTKVTTVASSMDNPTSSSSTTLSSSMDQYTHTVLVPSPPTTVPASAPSVSPLMRAPAPAPSLPYPPYSPAPTSIAPLPTTTTTPVPPTGTTGAYYPPSGLPPYGYTVMHQLQNGGAVVVPPPGSVHVPPPVPPVMTTLQRQDVPSTAVQTIDKAHDTKSEGVNDNEREQIHNRTEDNLTEPTVESKPSLVSKLKSTGCWALTIFLFSTILGITMLNQMPIPSSMKNDPISESSNGSSPVMEETTCFSNAGIEALDSQPQIVCDNPVPCPQYGRCAMGQLVDCKLNGGSSFGENESYFVTSSNMDSCVLSKAAVQDLMKVHQTLIDLTCNYTCSGFFGLWASCQLPSSQIFKGEESSDIQFSLMNVAELMGMTEEHILTLERHMEDGSNIVVKEVAPQDEGVLGVTTYSIGLIPEFVQMELPVSFPCWTRIVLWDLLKTIVHLMIGTLNFTVFLMWSIASTHPLFTLAIIFVITIVNWVKQRRHSVVQRREFVIEIQNTAYDKLVMDIDGGGNGYAALHLRDEIGHEMYPQRGKEREDFLTNVWPRVAKAVRTDNRVTKSRRHVGGKTLEWWEWVSGASKISRKIAMFSKKEV